jgi:hypothetical protein
MNKIVAGVMILTTSLFLSACDDNLSGGDPIIGFSDPLMRLAGTWEAVQVEFVAANDPLMRQEMIGSGWNFTTTIDGGGGFFATLAHPEVAVTTQTGTVRAEGGAFVFGPIGLFGNGPETMTAQWQGNGVVLTGRNVMHNFGNGTAVPANVAMLLRRR